MKSITSKQLKNAVSAREQAIFPNEDMERKMENIAQNIFKKVRKLTKNYLGITGVELGGSYAKGTWLPDSADIDIFIKFNPNVNENKFSNIAKDIGFEALDKYKPYLRYSDHPYVEAVVYNTKVNIVPCYEVDHGAWKSAADRTPFHTKFMKKELTPSMKTDVRILKRFLHCSQIYGAEISTQGLSGYVAEVLIYNYGSFKDTIDAIAKSKRGHVVGQTSEEFDTPITIMDPIDSKRNLAAAISVENIGKFVLLCRAFLENPSGLFFEFGKPLTKQDLFENCVTVSFKCHNMPPDMIWGQLKRAASSLARQMKNEGFSIVQHGALTDYNKSGESTLYFILESLVIPDTYSKMGPSFFSENDVSAFVSKNGKKSITMWVDSKGHIRVLKKRDENQIQADRFLENFLKYKLDVSGVPKELQPDISDGFLIFARQNAAKCPAKDALREALATDARIFSAD